MVGKTGGKDELRNIQLTVGPEERARGIPIADMPC